MSDDDHQDEEGADLESLTPDVPEERPLDALMPEMTGSQPSASDVSGEAPSAPDGVHPRVLEVELEAGHEWTLAFWSDPGASGVDSELQTLLRATILREMSRRPDDQRDQRRSFLGARILSFASLARETRSELEEQGFEETPYEPDKYSERLKAWQNEARAAELDPPTRPISIWNLPTRQLPSEDRDRVSRIVDEMLDELGGEVWGETPGGMSKLLARGLEDHFGASVELGGEGLRTLQRLIPEASGGLAWVPPLVFQAICDYVGVVLHGVHGVRVQWGICEPDDRGMIPPPMFREPETQQTFPVGRALVDACLLPNGGDEDLGARVQAWAAALNH